MSLVITRFAPSPTGFLHIGGIRTALVNYLLTEKSKSQNKDSKFFLRIEDTDKQRSENKYLESIISGLNWLNIKWDGEIYKQSNNLENHLEIANKLLNTNGAYKCICSSEKLDNLRKENLSKGLSIKRLCKTCENNKEIQSLDKNFCIRIKIRDDNYTEIKDEIQGNIKVSNNEIDNFILVRNDGTPTYMLSVVVDVTEEIVGTIPSITRALSAPRELVSPGATRVNVAPLPAPSTMVPLFNDKADVLP